MEAFFHRMDLQAVRLLSSILLRLLVAAALGGVIGLERQLKHKPAGLRTNMFICFGSAMFTILSIELAGEYTGDHTRIAAQIIPGIGFIGAGSILHARASITGITTAATLFVVASIGMAVGGGLYLPAVFATMVILVALELLGWVETRFNLKTVVNSYEAVGESAEAMVADVNSVLDELHKSMQSVQLGRTNTHYRVVFTVEGTAREQGEVFRRLRTSHSIQRLQSLGPAYDRD
jgi:putative Mg2+ transporter-C (MgtC) family protein